MTAFESRIVATPLSPAIGALVVGADLARPQSGRAIEAIKAALLRHHVLFFEGQAVTPESQRDFAAHFGALHVHPLYPKVEAVPEILLLDSDGDNPPENDVWHTDVTFIETPPLGSVLAARTIPPLGGDTSWSSMEAAYAALSPAFRAFLDGLTAEHDFAKAFPKAAWGRDGAQDQWDRTRATHPPVVHPVIRTHPESGRRGLFVNESFTTRILELKRGESDAVLHHLFNHVARPEFTIRWHWKPGDVAFWDNRSTQHYALADYLPHRRVMHRATILGDRPYFSP